MSHGVRDLTRIRRISATKLPAPRCNSYHLNQDEEAVALEFLTLAAQNVRDRLPSIKASFMRIDLNLAAIARNREAALEAAKVRSSCTPEQLIEALSELIAQEYRLKV